MDGGREAEISTYHNASGEHLSSMVLGGNATDIGKALAPLKDGGYVMGGVSLSTGSCNEDSVLVKFGANGAIEQALVIGNSTYHDRVVDIE